MTETSPGPEDSDAPATPPEGERAGDRPEPQDVAGGGMLEPTFVGSPAKVMRIGTMVKQLLEEIRNAPLDEAARGRMAEVHDRSLRELEDGLSPDLVDELQRITLPFSDDAEPSDAELRVAQAQLVGWLEGLFHGLQTALVAQRMSAQAQQLRALPGGTPQGPQGPVPGQLAPGPGREERHPGQYL